MVEKLPDKSTAAHPAIALLVELARSRCCLLGLQWCPLRAGLLSSVVDMAANRVTSKQSVMKAKTNTLLVWLAAIASFLQNIHCAEPPAIQRTEVSAVRGGIAFPPERRMWTRIVGKVKVLDAHSLVFENGTEVNLLWNMDAPDLEQKALLGASFYPAGKEAADYLRSLIGDQTVTFIGRREEKEGKRVRGTCFVGEKNLEIEMVRNGWAISDHEEMDPWEIIARENKRGLWRGQFVTPKRWRKGDRLPGE